MPLRVLFLGAAFAFAAPAVAGVQSAAAPSTATGAPQSEERKICRYEQTTGARTRGKKVCLTREEWRQRERESHYSR